MGALAPVSPWIPEDDFLLKNAVEAGASLESLAKGAVRFSRRFTVQELQERWLSLLYDPIVSAEAAFHMIEFEQPASSKLSKAGNPKERKGSYGKRKAESVRSFYYALRKKIHNEPFNSMDPTFLVAPSNCNYIGNEEAPLSGHCMLGSAVSNHLGLQESDLDIVRNVFPQIGDDAADDAFHSQFEDTIQEDFLVEPNIVHTEIPYLVGENQSQNEPVPDKLCQHKEFPVTGDSVLSDFHGDQVLRSQNPECSSSYLELEYSSHVPVMPIWREVEGISEPSVPVDLSLGEKDLQSKDIFSLPGDDDTKNAYDNVRTNSNSKPGIPSEELKATASAEGYLAELSNSLLEIANDEDPMFPDVDGKDVIDKSYYDGLSSLLLSSPNDVNQDHLLNVNEQEPSVAADHLKNDSGVCSKKLDNYGESCCSGGAVLRVQFPLSATPSNPQLPELSSGVICCVLNTEDPEIPCNDDVIFSNDLCHKSVASMARQNFLDADKQKFSSVEEFSSIQKTSLGDTLSVHRNLENPGTSHRSSQMIGSQVLPKVSLTHPVGDIGVNPGVKFEFSGSKSNHEMAGNTYGGSTPINSVSNIEALGPAKWKEHKTETAVVKQTRNNSTDALTEKPAIGSEGFKCFHYANASCFKSDIDARARIQNLHASNANQGCIDCAALEQIVAPMSNPDEPPIESDDDVPCFSDIEAMILDMDLDPEDQDSHFNEEVLRYQHEDAKRAIIRLEQCAHSCMWRAIASHGAFAILYGHHSKHYIKRPEVLIGRATEDVAVDIDLGREGRANKISRQQVSLLFP
uniref:Uncharacterized protein LOC8275810 n=1 Tax=Rhizophora mucronata TaxID=61149 RepID=A0A2P2JHG6_RHIMU